MLYRYIEANGTQIVKYIAHIASIGNKRYSESRDSLLPNFHPYPACSSEKCQVMWWIKVYAFIQMKGGVEGGWVGCCGAFAGLSRDSEQRLLLPIEAMCAMYFYSLRSICFNVPIKHVLFRVGNILIRVYIVRITKISLKQENVRKAIF